MYKRMLKSELDEELHKAANRGELVNALQKCLRGEEPLLERDILQVDSTGSSDLRIMQWNMLAQALATSDDSFIKCPPEALSWEKRRLYVVQELLQYDPDIICLEEVDNFTFLEDLLKKAGYEGYFHPKLDSPCNYITPNSGPDGCACFWKTSKLDSIKKTNFILAPDNAYTNQIGLFLVFKFGAFEFGVVVTHMKAKIAYSELRHAQGAYILKYLKENASALPLIVCGDFNGEPDEPFYKEFIDCDLGLLSTYRKLSGENKEPSFTTWKIRAGKKAEDPPNEVKRAIDYVWCTDAAFSVKGLLKLPTEQQLGENRLPSHSYPSDHVSLVVDLQVKSNL